ncbi:MAG: Penicillin-binding protein PbpB [Acidimicrobiales bacterium]|nr:MAG: penicillin-binding protein 2 [Actinomycetota bacterium]MBV6508756.1 Penicillin-binding protein PbpB [Acidimicrobiales bacterium]RIK06507.1 MAG: hypothetical protein DCC48_06220 [Acidobacteriota bacterium]
MTSTSFKGPGVTRHHRRGSAARLRPLSVPEKHRSRARSGRSSSLRPDIEARHAGLRRRLIAVVVIACLLAAGIIARLAFLQALDPAEYVTFGESQRIRTIELPASRGSVLDRNGVDLALSVPRSTVVADPSVIDDPEAVAEALAPVLGVSTEELVGPLSGEGRFVYVARQVDTDSAEAVRQLDLAGVWLEDEPARVYPSEPVGGAMLGETDIDGNGVAGVEQLYDHLLAGEPGEKIVERGSDQTSTIVDGELHVEPAVSGQDLLLTIDQTLQFEAEKILARGVEAAGAECGVAILGQPATGDLLAVANVCVDELGTARPVSYNMAFAASYEPGSVLKIVAAAGALEDGAITTETRFEVPDYYVVADKEFTDWEEEGHATGWWNLDEIISRSSNIGTIKVAQELGRDRLHHYLAAFGFGEQTAVGFPNEAQGILRPVEEWTGSDIGSVPIGQGIAVTPVQLWAAYNVIANDGVYVEPRLLYGTVDERGGTHPAPPSASRQVVSVEAAQGVTHALQEAVERGTASDWAIRGYDVAAKTGTAWIPQPWGGYEDELGNKQYVTSFAGFVPADDPQISMLVMLDRPTDRTSGSTASGPVFYELAKFALQHLGIPNEMGAPGEAEDAGESGEAAPLPGESVQAPAAAQPPTDGP